MERRKKTACRTEYIRNYMRNYRKKQRERGTAEKKTKPRLAEVSHRAFVFTRVLCPIPQSQKNDEAKDRRAAETQQRIRVLRHVKKDKSPSVEENEINNTSDFNNEGEKLYYTSPVIKSSHTAVDEACTSLKNNWKNEDLFSIFGEYVASRLRNLNTPRIQSICQYRINTILFELERDATASQCTEPISSTSTSQSNNHSFTSTSDYVTPDFFLSNINKEITDENY